MVWLLFVIHQKLMICIALYMLSCGFDVHAITPAIAFCTSLCRSFAAIAAIFNARCMKTMAGKCGTLLQKIICPVLPNSFRHSIAGIESKLI